jgi:hypothetical protein
MIIWFDLSDKQKQALIDQCRREGHDLVYIEDTHYQWSCARCNWDEHRTKPTIPLLPVKSKPRFEIVQNW